MACRGSCSVTPAALSFIQTLRGNIRWKVVKSAESKKLLGHSNMKEWSVYIIRCRDRSLYTGFSTDVQRRFGEHISGGRNLGDPNSKRLCGENVILDRDDSLYNFVRKLIGYEDVPPLLLQAMGARLHMPVILLKSYLTNHPCPK